MLEAQRDALERGVDVDEASHGGRSWVRRHGFMKYDRELPTRRPIPVRVLDWQEVYEDFPPEKVRTQGARCMDCGIPFCHTGCPLGNLIPEWNDLVYRDRWHVGERAAARDEQLPRVHRPAVPGAVRGRVRARHQRAAGHDQADRGRDRRPRVGGRLAHAAASRAAQDGQARRGRRLRAGRASPPRSSSRAPATTSPSTSAPTASAGCCATASPSSRWRSATSTGASRRWRPRAPSSARTRTSARTCR